MERTASAENIQTSALPQKRGDKQKGAPHERTEQTRIPHPLRRSVVALSLAGCGGPSAPPEPPAPPASESKELALFKAINEVWYEVNKEAIHNPKLDICKSVVYCQEAADLAKFTASPFETYEPEVDEEDYRKWNLPDDVFHEYQLRESEMIQEIRNKYGNGSYRGTVGVSNGTHDGMQLKQLYPSNPSEVREFVRSLAGGRGLASPHPEQWMIGLYCPTIKGKTYTVAVMVNFAPI